MNSFYSFTVKLFDKETREERLFVQVTSTKEGYCISTGQCYLMADELPGAITWVQKNIYVNEYEYMEIKIVEG